MTAIVECGRETRIVSRLQSIASTATIKSRVTDLLPPTLIVFGIVLTIAWTASLFWVLLSLVLLLL